jgi:hypothetical protein
MRYITKKHLSRRHFLRGTAGAAIALPLLESMLPAASAWAQDYKPRPRFSAIYMPHGKTMAKWTPATFGKDFAYTEILKPIEPYRDQVNIISGHRLPTAYGADGSAGANHTRSSAAFLTCVPVDMSSQKLGVSMDQVAAKAIGQDTPLPSLELSIEEGNVSNGAYRNTISWQSDVSPLPMYNNPQVVFERMFGEGGTPEERLARRSQASSLLDSVSEDIASLQRDLPGTDKERLDRYLTDVREIERRIELAGQLPEGFVVPERPAGIPGDFEQHIQLMFDLNVMAWEAEITRISTLMIAHEVSNATYPNSGVTDPFHNLSHHSNIQANKDRFAVLNTYHMTQIAYFLEKLKTTPDGDGNMLDNSLILYGSGISDGNQHNHDPLPVMLAGGASGALEGGRHIQVEDGTPLANLHVAVLGKLGVEATSFGDSNGVVEL